MQGRDQGFRVEIAASDEEEETWEEAMDEVEDIWMRDPAGEVGRKYTATYTLKLLLLTGFPNMTPNVTDFLFFLVSAACSTLNQLTYEPRP